MDNKLSELKEALEFLETTPFCGEWYSALVGGENGKNYHAVTNADDVVVRAADDSRHTSWLCDYLEAVSPVNIRALLAELESKSAYAADWCYSAKKRKDLLDDANKRIAELEAIATDYADKFQKAQDAAKHLIIMNDKDKKRITELDRSETQLIDERDSAHAALDDMYEAITGKRPEWSNWFGFADAIEEVELIAAGFTREGNGQ